MNKLIKIILYPLIGIGTVQILLMIIEGSLITGNFSNTVYTLSHIWVILSLSLFGGLLLRSYFNRKVIGLINGVNKK